MGNLLSRSRLFLNRNASAILTCLGGAGVVATSVMAVKATPKALKLLEQAEEEKGEKLTKTEAVLAAGPVYIPAIVTGATTIACIFGANVLNKRKQAALMSAYALVDNSYKEYKRQVAELYGDEAGERINEEIAKDAYEDDDVEIEDGKQLFYDLFSDRYFNATPEAVQQAEYRINRNLTMRDYAYLNEFYEELDIEPIDSGYEFGWSVGLCYEMYWQPWIDFTHKKVMLDDNLECTIIEMQQPPVVGFEDH